MANPPQRNCPFEVDARDCKYQETRAKDLLSAMRGDIVFICVLSGDIPVSLRCLRMEKMFAEVLTD